MSEQQLSPDLQRSLGLAVRHQGAGRLSEAELICRQILQTDPDQPVALHLLGVIALQTGNDESAADLIAKSVRLAPELAAAHYNLAIALQNLGRLEDAVASYRTALDLRPGHAEAHNNLGNALRNLGQPGQALASFQEALAAKPDYAEAHNNLALALIDLGRLDEAMASCKRALAIRPDYGEAQANIGLALRDLGNHEDAVASYLKALELRPDYAMIHSNLGASLQSLGRLDEAMASYHRALDIEPDLAAAHNNLGNALHDLGNFEDAIKRYREAVALDPGNDLFAANLAASLRSVSFTSVDDDLYQELLRLLERPKLPPSYIGRAAESALRRHADFSAIVEAAGSYEQGGEFGYGAIAERLSAIPLLLRILELCPIRDVEIERMLTLMRRLMLEEASAGETVERVYPFAAALAHHCYNNEYVYAESGQEKDALERLQQGIAARLQQGEEVAPSQVVALAAYRPLFELPLARQLSEREWEDAVAGVIRRQIAEPLEERALGEQIPRITAIEDAVSRQVREQYEENPYPRWIKSGLAHKSASLGAVLRAAPLSFDLADIISPERPQILMAGCGTGQHALYTASRFANAEMLAVDLSLNSLAYAKRKSREYGFSDIEYVQGDILELAGLGRRFDLIGCAGVLHHLGEPLAGWRVLTDLLRPGGVMKIGLYSETARRHLAAGRALIAEKGYSPTARDIRRCRDDIRRMAAGGDGDMAKICNGEDFYSLSRCRDLLFHSHEQLFTLPAIAEALQSLGLKFLGFELDDRRTLSRFRAAHPDRGDLTSLALWHAFERDNPETFAGMYQFWCRKP
ncbi:MAG: tetratricopeptide repeat protein [Alphaproteobacteria bacterium]|jgi:tetratricopeptide (TPR) repeat protein/2-polyprenyl-3-methyl-5-hydroxy-6-metoxy-1,4-benzoquinol methylase|nr:tetratricopeptide repeat protein [Alphaproteobacteria bacterium]MDP6589597.1 tetratricopeptide repeat protein [Alphaproteobacteria bacterium]MDP6819076.1 tetratricopeptide repeat protein [Alphaproteobacteria bacterium]